jgi:hypothetical protein
MSSHFVGREKADWQPHQSRPFKLKASQVFLYLFGCLLWVYVLPGLVAYRDGVITDQGITSKLRGEAARKWQDYKDDVQSQQQLLTQVRAAIKQTLATGGDVRVLVTAQQEYVGLSVPPPITVSGFSGNLFLDILFLSYITLGALLSIAGVRMRTKFDFWWVFRFGTLIYVLFMWSNWLRNSVSTEYERGRRFYTFTNWDMSSASFLLQEARLFVLFILVAMLWDLYRKQHAHIVQSQLRDEPAALSLRELVERGQEYTEMLLAWQVSSLLVLALLLPWSYRYWQTLASYKDFRYLPAALAIHLIWLATWCFVSLPLLAAGRWWARGRLDAQMSAVSSEDDRRVIFDAVRGTSEWQVLAAGLTGVGSLIAALIKVLS